MKLAEFKTLCEKLWQECKGEVVTLWLTEKSYKELHEESLREGVSDSVQLYIREDYEDLGPAHPVFNNVINPITRSPVRMRISRDRDIADIFSLQNKQAFSRELKNDQD